MGYILITPIKDEAKFLHSLKTTILNQSVRPILWVIVNSGSLDMSFNIAKDIFGRYDWIYIIDQKSFLKNNIYSHENFSIAINEGYSFAKKLCNDMHIDYSYIGKTDASPSLSPNYFSLLMREMERDPKLAFSCGQQRVLYKGKKFDLKPLPYITLTGINDIRLYKRQFFEEMNGYPLMPSPDSVLTIKALNRGWKVKVANEAFFIKPRLGGSKIGHWNGAKLKGEGMYKLGYHPLLVLLNSLYLTYKYPTHYQGAGILAGYIQGYCRKYEKITDREVLDYFGKKRLINILKYR